MKQALVLVLALCMLTLAGIAIGQESESSRAWVEKSERRLYPDETLALRQLMTSPEAKGANIYGRYIGDQLHTVVIEYDTVSVAMSKLGLVVVVVEDRSSFRA